MEALAKTILQEIETKYKDFWKHNIYSLYTWNNQDRFLLTLHSMACWNS
jgi:hypothetical protein